METWSDIPAGSSIKVTVELGNRENRVVDSTTIDLKRGHQKVSVGGLKAGEKVCLRIRLAADKFGSTPVLQTVSLLGANDSVRWATVADWQSGSLTGGLKVQK
jgi:hypothetical protein